MSIEAFLLNRLSLDIDTFFLDLLQETESSYDLLPNVVFDKQANRTGSRAKHWTCPMGTWTRIRFIL